MKKTKMKYLLSASLGLVLATAAYAADTPAPEAGFVSLFDGKTLDGWKVGDNAVLFHVEDGMIVMDCPATNHSPAHLFYEGDVQNHTFKNFDLRVDVMTYPHANSGIYFHTKFQDAGFPKYGLECQVNTSHSDWRRTGSLYAVKNINWGPEAPSAEEKEREHPIMFDKPVVVDNVWYTQEIIYQNGHVTVKLDGKTVLEYDIDHPDTEHELVSGAIWEPTGTFCLQGHPPLPNAISKVCFKNIRVKVLAD